MRFAMKTDCFLYFGSFHKRNVFFFLLDLLCQVFCVSVCANASAHTIQSQKMKRKPDKWGNCWVEHAKKKREEILWLIDCKASRKEIRVRWAKKKNRINFVVFFFFLAICFISHSVGCVSARVDLCRFDLMHSNMDLTSFDVFQT